ncbi:MAG: winged helix-turn-helix transcriptional regulator [Gammaproteobacteria bacterium]|nr:winged helix-turn-helix transcriptional regulator [Gammaproteobacteria bacterium]NKB64097.1 winged helix-turn-helix transcriptional regulator [Gammaproteobacteria bacterium]
MKSSYTPDKLDRKIIFELQKDARISNAELSRRVWLSQSPCWTRVKNLENSGIISGYQAVISQKALGRKEIMMVQVSMDRHDDKSFSKAESVIRTLPEVLEAHLCAAEFDFLIKIAIRDTKEFEQFLKQKIYKIPGIKNVRSILCIRDILKEDIEN